MNTALFQPAVHEFSLDDSGWNFDAAFRRLARLRYAIVFDGGSQVSETDALNRYSFLSADPIDRLVVNGPDDFSFQELRAIGNRYAFQRVDDLPPFQGGLAGLLSYGLNKKLESIPSGAVDEFRVPLVSINVYDVVIAIDKFLRKGWIISQGWPAPTASSLTRRVTTDVDFPVENGYRRRQAELRLEFFRETIFGEEHRHESETAVPGQASAIEPQSPMHRLDHELELYSNLTAAQYHQMVARAVRYIREGDIFQVNLSQRLLTPAIGSAEDLYLELRRTSPAPFSGYFDFGDGHIVSASPERLVSVVGDVIQTRPIKGTRRRTHYPEVDLNLRQELSASEKDRAENIMIVDLMRNDLSAVAEPDSVVVKKFCGIEQFQDVLHLVSVVQATLRSGCDSFDLLQNVFPGGSITGAPKIRAMEIVSELELAARGAYCGSLGYIGPDGGMDFNILIRTITAAGGWWQIPVGGGIVSDSVPEQEYEETIAKSVGMLKAISRLRKAALVAGPGPPVSSAP